MTTRITEQQVDAMRADMDALAEMVRQYREDARVMREALEYIARVAGYGGKNTTLNSICDIANTALKGVGHE